MYTNAVTNSVIVIVIFIPMLQQPLEGQVLLTVEISRSHSDIPHSVGILSTSDQPNAEPSA